VLGVCLKDPPWGEDRKISVEKRQIPRDIEAEFTNFHTEIIGLSETACIESLGHETIVTSSQQPIRGTFLVSFNTGRPKKKDVTLLDDKILFRRPNGSLSEEIAVPSCNLLLIAQRSGGIKTTTLTVFWRSLEDIKSPTGLEAFEVENAEIFFDDFELLKTWQLGLGRFEQLAA
jgi:hypothetical protein